MMGLLSLAELPSGFEYPRQFRRLVDLQLTKLEPWWVIEGELLAERFLGLRERYANRTLVPFAVRQDNDDVACWDVDRGDIVIVHDFASPGSEQRGAYAKFEDWLRAAIEDFLEFE